MLLLGLGLLKWKEGGQCGIWEINLRLFSHTIRILAIALYTESPANWESLPVAWKVREHYAINLLIFLCIIFEPQD
jgi:hypothetical protein